MLTGLLTIPWSVWVAVAVLVLALAALILWRSTNRGWESKFQAFSLFGASVAFIWAVFHGVLEFDSHEQERQETQRIEATRPFLMRQLELYTLATQAAATVATSKSDEDVRVSEGRFWSLYWGELAMVEDKQVERAMIRFGYGIDPKKKRASKGCLEELSLHLAHSIRDSLADSWKVDKWRNPHRSVTAKEDIDLLLAPPHACLCDADVQAQWGHNSNVVSSVSSTECPETTKATTRTSP